MFDKYNRSQGSCDDLTRDNFTKVHQLETILYKCISSGQFYTSESTRDNFTKNASTRDNFTNVHQLEAIIHKCINSGQFYKRASTRGNFTQVHQLGTILHKCINIQEHTRNNKKLTPFHGHFEL